MCVVFTRDSVGWLMMTQEACITLIVSLKIGTARRVIDSTFSSAPGTIAAEPRNAFLQHWDGSPLERRVMTLHSPSARFPRSPYYV
jgi:hypothetical protein